MKVVRHQSEIVQEIEASRATLEYGFHDDVRQCFLLKQSSPLPVRVVTKYAPAAFLRCLGRDIDLSG